MVKNSKYLLAILGLVVQFSLNAQSGNGNFNAIERDAEVTRVTFENFLKKWSDEPLMNVFSHSEAEYQKGKGLTIKLLAENARIFINVQSRMFTNADAEVMDTFFSENMVKLQQERLQKSISKFLIDFNTYLPKLPNNESIQFILDVKDPEDKNEKEEEQKPTPLAYKRTYTLEAKVQVSDFENFKQGSINSQEFSTKINFETK